ncbi:MAG TPA: exosortase/archaeosortase family protein [Planctomycetota bacterium]|nr:exosortase/archaeosortase family protein [Planctomycetota bacterium]
MTSLLAQSPAPPATPPLLGTTGTELLQFALLVAAGVWYARREGRPAARFVASALLVVSLFYLLCPETSAVQRAAGDALMCGMAVVQSAVMRLGGAPVYADGPSVAGGGFQFTYVQGCMGLSYLAMAILVLLAQPTSWRRRLLGLPVLVTGMLALNLVRLVVLYQLWAGGHAAAYDGFHRVGGGLFAAGAFALYVGILGFRVPKVPAPAPVPAAAKA